MLTCKMSKCEYAITQIRSVYIVVFLHNSSYQIDRSKHSKIICSVSGWRFITSMTGVLRRVEVIERVCETKTGCRTWDLSQSIC